MRPVLLVAASVSLVALAACAQGSAGIGVGGGGGAGGSSSDGGASSQGGGSSTGDGGAGSFSGATSSTSDSSSQATGSTGSTSAQSSSAQTTGAGGGSCSESPCKLVSPQCGCPTGEMCTIGASDQRTCVTAGTAAPGAACGAVDCAPGGICLGSGNVGFCGEFCKSDADCSAPAICILGLADNNGGTIPNASLCSSNCSPIAGTGCPTGMGCQIVQEENGAMRFGFSCNVAGTKTDGQSCTSSNECAPNYGCYNINNVTQCARNCDVFNDQCPGIKTCGGLVDANQQPIVINGISMGVCI
jgi:hypothetical protein